MQFSSKRLDLAFSLCEGKHVMTGPQGFYFEAKCLECMKTAKAFSFRRYKSNKWRQCTAIQCRQQQHRLHSQLSMAGASVTEGAQDWNCLCPKHLLHTVPQCLWWGEAVCWPHPGRGAMQMGLGACDYVLGVSECWMQLTHLCCINIC